MRVHALYATVCYDTHYGGEIVDAVVGFLTPPTPEDIIAAIPPILQILVDDAPAGATHFEGDIEWDMVPDVPVLDIVKRTPDYQPTPQRLYTRQRNPDNFGAAAVGFLIGASL